MPSLGHFCSGCSCGELREGTTSGLRGKHRRSVRRFAEHGPWLCGLKPPRCSTDSVTAAVPAHECEGVAQGHGVGRARKVNKPTIPEMWSDIKRSMYDGTFDWNKALDGLVMNEIIDRVVGKISGDAGKYVRDQLGLPTGLQKGPAI